MAVKVLEQDYLDAVENYYGWCEDCKEFTREMTEPDAEKYDCPKCHGRSVCGAENALIAGRIEFE